jgi:phage repressor protein C with HTH and peptisase S24 domain
MGEQKSTMTLSQDGDSVSGTNAGATGSADVKDGKIDGNTLTWKMDITVPMPMTLEGTATVDGDSMSGTIKAGAFGEMPFSATKTG